MVADPTWRNISQHRRYVRACLSSDGAYAAAFPTNIRYGAAAGRDAVTIASEIHIWSFAGAGVPYVAHTVKLDVHLRMFCTALAWSANNRLLMLALMGAGGENSCLLVLNPWAQDPAQQVLGRIALSAAAADVYPHPARPEVVVVTHAAGVPSVCCLRAGSARPLDLPLQPVSSTNRVIVGAAWHSDAGRTLYCAQYAGGLYCIRWDSLEAWLAAPSSTPLHSIVCETRGLEGPALCDTGAVPVCVVDLKLKPSLPVSLRCCVDERGQHLLALSTRNGIMVQPALASAEMMEHAEDLLREPVDATCLVMPAIDPLSGLLLALPVAGVAHRVAPAYCFRRGRGAQMMQLSDVPDEGAGSSLLSWADWSVRAGAIVGLTFDGVLFLVLPRSQARWPGPMYPPSFQLFEGNQMHVEQEDEFDREDEHGAPLGRLQKRARYCAIDHARPGRLAQLILPDSAAQREQAALGGVEHAPPADSCSVAGLAQAPRLTATPARGPVRSVAEVLLSAASTDAADAAAQLRAVFAAPAVPGKRCRPGESSASSLAVRCRSRAGTHAVLGSVYSCDDAVALACAAGPSAAHHRIRQLAQHDAAGISVRQFQFAASAAAAQAVADWAAWQDQAKLWQHTLQMCYLQALRQLARHVLRTCAALAAAPTVWSVETGDDSAVAGLEFWEWPLHKAEWKLARERFAPSNSVEQAGPTAMRFLCTQAFGEPDLAHLEELHPLVARAAQVWVLVGATAGSLSKPEIVTAVKSAPAAGAREVPGMMNTLRNAVQALRSEQALAAALLDFAQDRQLPLAKLAERPVADCAAQVRAALMKQCSTKATCATVLPHGMEQGATAAATSPEASSTEPEPTPESATPRLLDTSAEAGPSISAPVQLPGSQQLMRQWLAEGCPADAVLPGEPDLHAAFQRYTRSVVAAAGHVDEHVVVASACLYDPADSERWQAAHRVLAARPSCDLPAATARALADRGWEAACIAAREWAAVRHCVREACASAAEVRAVAEALIAGAQRCADIQPIGAHPAPS